MVGKFYMHIYMQVAINNTKYTKSPKQRHNMFCQYLELIKATNNDKEKIGQEAKLKAFQLN